MKNIIALVIMGGVIGGLYLIAQSNSGVIVDNVKPEVITEEVHPEWATDEDAVAAAEAVVLRKAQQAELSALEASFASSTAVYEAERADFLENKERLEKLIGSYWTVKANVVREIRKTFPETPNTAVAVAMAESGMQMIQSNHRYPKDMAGHTAGTREQSFCYYQIHAPAHDKTADRLGLGDYRTNPESCIKMARVVYDQAGGWSPWTVYQKKMHLAYVR